MKITVTDHILDMLAIAFGDYTGINPYATDDDTLIAIARHFDVPDDYFIRLRDYYQTSKKLKDFFNSIDVQVDIIGDNESPNFKTILKYICKSVNFYGYWNTESGIKQFSVTPIFADIQDPDWENARGYWLWSFPTYEEGKKFADMFGITLKTF